MECMAWVSDCEFSCRSDGMVLSRVSLNIAQESVPGKGRLSTTVWCLLSGMVPLSTSAGHHCGSNLVPLEIQNNSQ